MLQSYKNKRRKLKIDLQITVKRCRIQLDYLKPEILNLQFISDKIEVTKSSKQTEPNKSNLVLNTNISLDSLFQHPLPKLIVNS